MSKSAPHPLSRKTPRGGRMMARMILQISLAVKGMMFDFGESEKLMCISYLYAIDRYGWWMSRCSLKRRGIPLFCW